MLVDDVITAGTAIRESMEIIQARRAAGWRTDLSGSSGAWSRRNFRDSGSGA
jgi:hypothetical protein